MDQEMICGWTSGPMGEPPVQCGKPAKALLTRPGERTVPVCGVHVRSAKSARSTSWKVTDLPGPDVRPGQVWEDADPRGYGRRVRVVEVNGSVATVEQVSARGGYGDQPGRQTRIRLDRFRPTSTGYRLVTDAPREG